MLCVIIIALTQRTARWHAKSQELPINGKLLPASIKWRGPFVCACQAPINREGQGSRGARVCSLLLHTSSM